MRLHQKRLEFSLGLIHLKQSVFLAALKSSTVKLHANTSVVALWAFCECESVTRQQAKHFQVNKITKQDKFLQEELDGADHLTQAVSSDGLGRLLKVDLLWLY